MIRRAKRPSLFAIITLGLLSLGMAVFFLIKSFAGTSGAMEVYIYRDGGLFTASNLGVQIKNVGSTAGCAGGFNATGITSGEWWGIFSYQNQYVRAATLCNTGSGGNKLYQVINANTDNHSGYVFQGARVAYNNHTYNPLAHPYQFFVNEGETTRLILDYSSPAPPPPPPPPPTPSGCGSGTLNDRCASVSFSVAPNSVPYGGQVTLSWTSSWTTGCEIRPTNISVGSAGSRVVSPYQDGRNEWGITCFPNSGGGNATALASTTQSPKPTINSFSGNQNISHNTTTTLSWTSSNTTGCTITGGPGTPVNVGASTSWTSPKLTAGTNYSIQCQNSVAYKSTSRSLGITVGGAPPPELPDGCGPGTKNNRCQGGGGGGGTGTYGKPQTTAARPNAAAPQGDSQRPSTPANLVAFEDNGSVKLTWDASTDDSGIAGYIIERSTDNTEWETLSEISDTTYTDSDANFNTLYYYRVSAKDTNNNLSDFAVVEITTGEFQANAFKDADSTITSEDGVVNILIPTGALTEDAACEVIIDDESANALGKKKLLHGPYLLVCKNKSGSIIEKFEKPVVVELSISEDAKKKSPALFGFADGKWNDSKIKYSKDAPNFSFETDTPAPFAVLSASSFNWLWLLLLLLLGLLIGGFIWWRRRNSDGSTTYIGSDYNPSTMDNPGSSSAVTPANSDPSALNIPGITSPPASSQPPGEHQIEVAPTPVTNPALEHHSPLDRLNEMESAETGGGGAIPDDLSAPGDTAAGGVEPKPPK